MSTRPNPLKQQPHAVKSINGPTSGGGFEQEMSAGASLSSRQTEIARMVALGLSDKEIANELGLAEGTVGQYLKAIFQKRRIHSRAALASLFHLEIGPGKTSWNTNER